MSRPHLIILFFLLSVENITFALETPYDYTIFTNSRMPNNYFFSKTTATNGSQVKNISNKLPVSADIFYTPGNSLLLEYTNSAKGSWSAFIYKSEVRGQDHFRPATHLSVHLRIVSRSLIKQLPYIQLLYKDSTLSRRISLHASGHTSWQEIFIPLDSFKKINQLSEISGVVFSQHGNQGHYKIYIDDIECVSINNTFAELAPPSIIKTEGYSRHVNIEWAPVTDDAVRFVKIYRSKDGKNFNTIGIQSPHTSIYTDFTGESGKTYYYEISLLDRNYDETMMSATVSASTKSMKDDEMLSMVQQACFRYYWDGAEATSGLALENIPGRHDMIASGASGFGIMALIAGTERNFITRNQSVERFTRIVNYLDTAQTFHGAYPHFINGPTGKVEPFFGKKDNGGDLVETSFLVQGLLAARSYFDKDNEAEKNIRQKITRIWERIEWSWYKQYPDSKFLYWHWSPDNGWIINHPLIGWNETMVTYLLAIASPTFPVQASMYYTGWANQEERGQKYRSGWGCTKDGSMYVNGNTYEGIRLDVGVSNGGPLFFTHYSFLGYDPHEITDRYTNYFTNNKNISLINHRYCVRNPKQFKGYGDSCWGLTASDGPYTYAADEPVLRQDRGKIAPTGALGSFPYTPEHSMKALKNYYYNYGHFLWGEYGFRDAFNITENWCSDIYMGLNQAPIVVMIENYRSGLLWKLIMKDKDVQAGLEKLKMETMKQ